MDEMDKKEMEKMMKIRKAASLNLAVIDGLKNHKCHCEADIKPGEEGLKSEIAVNGNMGGHFLLICGLVKGFMEKHDIEVDVICEAIKVHTIARDEISKEHNRPSVIMVDLDKTGGEEKQR